MSPLTLGVEDELFLHDEETLQLSPGGPGAFGAGTLRDSGEVKPEISDAQIELATRPATRHEDLLSSFDNLRRYAATRAAAHGLLVLPTGTPVLGRLDAQSASDHDRYHLLRERFGRLVREQQFSGLHVHIGVPDEDARAVAADAMRPWLPVLAALTVNSPYWFGDETGFASWRLVNRQRWPVSGVAPEWGTHARYDAQVADLLGVGAATDPGGLYWDVRLSHRYPRWKCGSPTHLTCGEAVAVACLVRAVAATAVAADRVPHVPDPDLLRAHVFAAARNGLDALVTDPVGGALTTAEQAADSLLTFAGAALSEVGDAGFVDREVRRIHRHGTGAERQRTTRAMGGGLSGVVRRWALPTKESP